MKQFNLGGSVLSGGVEGLVISLLQSAGKVAQEQGVEYLKSKMFGIGTNDEQLFLSACSYALNNAMITETELSRVINVIRSYSSSQQSRIIRIIGKGEDELIMPQDSKKNDDKKKPVSAKANIKGAEILVMLSKFSNKKMKEILDAAGVSRSFLKDLEDALTSKLKPSVTDLKKDGDSFFAKETWLERMAKKRNI
jgi:hypothetical protein